MTRVLSCELRNLVERPPVTEVRAVVSLER